MNCGNQPIAFKEELERKVFKYAHKRPIIYFQHYNRDRFIDNTKDRWRKCIDIFNKEDMLDELFLKARQYENKILYNNVIDELNEQNRNKMNRIKNKMLTYQRRFHNVIEELNEKIRKKKNRKYYYKREWAKKGYVFNDFDAFYKKYVTINNCERCDNDMGSFCNTRGRNSRQVLHVGGGINRVVCRVCLDIWEADW